MQSKVGLELERAKVKAETEELIRRINPNLDAAQIASDTYVVQVLSNKQVCWSSSYKRDVKMNNFKFGRCLSVPYRSVVNAADCSSANPIQQWLFFDTFSCIHC